MVSKEIETGNENRTNLENSLYDADAISKSSGDTMFTGIGYFDEDKLIAYAYNKMVYTRVQANGEVLPQVDGVDVSF